jgi:NAD(P)-dependent dehydrogenase (short-subunit alcohol dehydrogenase family)
VDQLQGKVAVVTGAASGIGLAMARRFSQEGMAVVLADLDERGVERAADGIRADGGEVVAVRTDCGDRGSIDALRDATLSAFGAVHLVCNNAGLGGGGPMGTDSLDEADWRRAMDVNYFGLLFGVEAFLPLLLEQDEGHVVNTSSRQGLVSSGGSAAYCASKAAAISLTETLHDELAARGTAVGVSVLCPGGVRTGMLKPPEDLPPDTDPAFRALKTERYLAAASAQEVADLVVSAVRQQRLYVLTHAETIDWLQSRVDRMSADLAALGAVR